MSETIIGKIVSVSDTDFHGLETSKAEIIMKRKLTLHRVSFVQIETKIDENSGRCFFEKRWKKRREIKLVTFKTGAEFRPKSCQCASPTTVTPYSLRDS